MSENNNLQEQGNGTQGTENGQGAAGKTFTQEQVNDFIRSRLDKMRRQAETEAESKYSAKLAELQKKEMQLMTREKLAARGMSLDLAGVISATDEKDLDSKLDVLQKTYDGGTDGKPAGSGTGSGKGTGFNVGSISSGPSGGGVFVNDPIRGAMGLKERRGN